MSGRGDLLSGLWRRGALPAGLDLSDWADLLGQARASLLGARLALWLDEHGGLDAVPERPRQYLRSALEIARRQQEGLRWEWWQVRRALAPLQAPVLLLKGGAYIVAGLPAAHGRTLSDIDLLVPRARLAEAESALLAAGWISQENDAYNQRYYREWMHELPPMVNLKRSTVVDVHHNILPRTARHVPDAGKLLQASLPIAGSRMRMLAPSDMVIHSATHLFHEGELKNGLRDLHDLDALFTSFSQGDAQQFWQDLIERSIELGLTWPVLLAMRYCEKLLQTRVPSSAMEAAKRAAGLSALRLALLDAMYLPAFQPDHPLVANTRSQLARAALYLRGHALRMPLWQLSVHLGRKAVLRLFKHSSRRL